MEVNSIAAAAGFMVDDVIVKLNNRPADNVQTIIQAVNDLPVGRPAVLSTGRFFLCLLFSSIILCRLIVSIYRANSQALIEANLGVPYSMDMSNDVKSIVNHLVSASEPEEVQESISVMLKSGVIAYASITYDDYMTGQDAGAYYIHMVKIS